LESTFDVSELASHYSVSKERIMQVARDFERKAFRRAANK
jgi:hypothetical protein